MERNEKLDLEKLANAFFEELHIVNCEYGGIGLDSKRPFGNSSVENDMLEIIGWEEEGDDGEDKCYASYQRDYVNELYSVKLIPFLREGWKNRK